ncbi:hypothetical protein EDD18DRAFT_1216246 [Armillaria luteobubalina]|uniref:ShKT domain-containing protein n=1 Tax=Armillaria luteobubalina TaxID=153913 RepID=A0AA39NZT9_9AGAR|nr:hypothetical protein EDD18DRAFT_1219705 [Armillaria luteobubalina]KAK0476273.1 hypothetical protein EDD18DRAFT_1216246 [Armillaria luteobubalina]
MHTTIQWSDPRTMTSNVLLLSFFLGVVSLCLVRGQTTNATCVSSYDWANNTLGQSPCVVASYIMAACINACGRC